MKKVSVIIPIYNVEMYLVECLESCVNQTIVEDIEVILVNDGSPDKSQLIIDEYVEAYPDLFIPYLIENGGLGNARNYGLTKTSGEYVAFIDSDDIISHNFCEIQYNLAKENDADVVRCHFKRFTNPNLVYKYINELQDSKVFMDYVAKNGAVQEELSPKLQLLIWHTACMGIYRREKLIEIDFKFPYGKFEDPIMKYLFLKSNKIVICPYRLYYYRMRPGSITDKLSFEDRDIVFDRWKGVYELYKKEGQTEGTGIKEAFFNTAGGYPLILNYLNEYPTEQLEEMSKNNFFDEYINFYKELDPNLELAFISRRPYNRKHLKKAIVLFYENKFDEGKKEYDKTLAYNIRVKKRMKIKNSISRFFSKLFSKKTMNKLKLNNLRELTYAYTYKNRKIERNVVLLEAYHGKNFNCNVYYIAEELIKKGDYDVYVASNSPVDLRGLSGATIIKHRSKMYYKLLGTANYIFNNTSFPNVYIKKEGQVVINTWHGTPLKTLGNDMIDDRYKFGNIQRTIGLSDYMLLSNEFTKEKMLYTHSLDKILGDNTYVLPSARNSIFFDDEAEKAVRKELGLENKKIIVYMPTWRGSVWASKDTNNFFNETLEKLANELSDDYVLFAKFHSNNNNFELKTSDKVRVFPESMETYRFLNAADILISDYSSVMFDFALKNRQIILYTPDLEEYIEERGMYFDIHSLGFDVVKSFKELTKAVKSDKDVDYSSINEKFNNLDNINGAREVVDFIMTNAKKQEPTPVNIMYTNLLKAPYLTDFMKRIRMKNLIFSFSAAAEKNNVKSLDEITENMDYYPYVGVTRKTIGEYFAALLFNKKNFISSRLKAPKIYYRSIKNNADRLYNFMRIDVFIFSSNYSMRKIKLFNAVEAQRKIMILDYSFFSKEYTKHEMEDFVLALDSSFMIVILDDIENFEGLLDKHLDKVKKSEDLIKDDLVDLNIYL